MFTKLKNVNNFYNILMKVHLTLLTLISFGLLQAQTFYSNGAQIGVNTGAQMIVKAGGLPSTGSLENASNGTFKNMGQVYIEGDFINSNGTADGFASNTGEYIVFGDWVNSATFNADQSKVFLRGTNQQITGSSVTTFYDLIAENPGTVKTQTIDANVAGTLTLNSNELATGNNKMTILNPNPSSIIVNGVNDAFVSSTGVGKLSRYTNSTSEYLFPTGWNNAGIPIIREASVVPSNNANHIYDVRFAFNSLSTTTTTDDGYSINSKAANVQSVNDKFYHLVASNDNTSADLGIFFDPIQDGAWTSVGRWESLPQWQDLLQASQATSSPRANLVRSAWVDNEREPHALIRPIVLETEYDFPNAFIPGATDPSVPAEDRFFSIINFGQKVVLDELMVFNRWGEMVFNSKREGTDKWDGFFQGKLQQQGNYTYLAKLRRSATGESLPVRTGNLSLIW